MQLLRTLQVLSEKDADDESHHRLLLLPPPPPPASHTLATSLRGEGGGSEAGGSEASGSEAPAALTAAATAAAAGEAEAGGEAGAAAGSAAGSPVGEGLLFRILRLLLEQPTDSVYMLGLASCVHKWVQASTHIACALMGVG